MSSMDDDTTPPTTTESASLDVSTAGVQAPSNVPDLMKIGALPINTQMDVETDILEPVVFSESFARFRLQNKGILHSNSKLIFGLDITSGSKALTILPPNIGIHSLVDRAVLKVGTKTICETDGYNHFMSFRSSFVNPQHNKQREGISTGRIMCRKWDYELGANASSGSGRTDSVNEASGYSIDTGYEIDALNKEPGDREYKLAPYLYLNASASRSEGTGTSDFQIAINELFPFLKMNQLPLYMMKEEIDIELHFATELKRAVLPSGNTSTMKAQLVRNDCKFIADYIYYPQEIMTAYQTANNQMSFTYVDYRHVKHTIDNSGDTSNTIILNVGGAGRVVNKLFYGLATPDSDPTPERGLFNSYIAQGVIDNGTEFGAVSHNIRYNDHFLYPVDITNNARLLHNIQQAEGSVPFISKDEYSNELGLISSTAFNGYDLSTNLANKNYWIEDRLNRNERINSRGIEVYQTWGKLPTESYTMRGWLEVVRYATLKDGVLQCYYA